MTSIANLQSYLFLVCYVILLFITYSWSASRRKKTLNSFNPSPGTQVSLSEPIEIAYLAGGITRCTEVAVIGLIEKNAIAWKPPHKNCDGRLTESEQVPEHSHWLEKSLHSFISLRGQTGIPLKSLGPSMLNGTLALETQLATQGLRPTEEELNSKKWIIPLPLIFLLFIGLFKLIIEYSEKGSIGILAIFVLMTFIATIKIYSGIGRLSPAGKILLKKLRAGRTSTTELGLINVALFGITKSKAYHNMPKIDSSMLKEFDKLTRNSTGSNGCGGAMFSGGDSNGGHSGCGGGGGCGGCGGS